MGRLDHVLGIPASSITPEFVERLLAQRIRESLTLEFKEAAGSRILDSIAAMANSYGGLILVGVSDRHEVVGVAERVFDDMVNRCYAKLEPPFVPDMALVDGVGPSDETVLAIRVDPQRCPRPTVLDGKVLIRLQGRNAPADRARIRELFTAPMSPAGGGLGGDSSPSRWYPPEGMDQKPTFVVRAVARARATGMPLPPVDTEMRRDLHRRLSDSQIAKWRSENLDLRDRLEATQWEIAGVNSSVQASMTLAAPLSDVVVPIFRAILSLPEGQWSGPSMFLLDAIQQGDPVPRPLDRLVELCTLVVHEVVSDTGLPLLREVRGAGMWVEGLAEMRMGWSDSALSDWVDLSRVERLPDSHDFRQTNPLILTGGDLVDRPVRPQVVDWLKRLLLDLGYADFEDLLERWRI